IARSGNDVTFYCHKGGQFGPGVVVDIPLKNDGYQTDPNGNPLIKGLGAVSVDSVTIDPVSGHVLLIATSSPYGPAVWAYDGPAQHFLGVTPTGTTGYFYSGFDSHTGRLYLHDADGFVIVDGRHDPLPGGTRFH